jgi:hypothetical protein
MPHDASSLNTSTTTNISSFKDAKRQAADRETELRQVYQANLPSIRNGQRTRTATPYSHPPIITGRRRGGRQVRRQGRGTPPLCGDVKQIVDDAISLVRADVVIACVVRDGQEFSSSVGRRGRIAIARRSARYWRPLRRFWRRGGQVPAGFFHQPVGTQ